MISVVPETATTKLIRTLERPVLVFRLMEMTSEKDELLPMLEKQREMELTNAKRCKEKEERLKSSGARLVLYQIRMDSTKHAQILHTLIDAIKEGTPKYLWDYRIDKYVGQVATEQLLEEHIKMEKEMIQRNEEAIKKTDDPGIKMMLQHIVEDEKRHHKMLMDVVKRLHRLGP